MSSIRYEEEQTAPTGQPVIALVDCNNFYASCERAFNPKLMGKPVVILSNNDGCIIARSDEAKALGIAMGEPFFKVRHLLHRHGVRYFSSNYPLYADMSHRVAAVLQRFTPEVEVYSIDESFLDLSGVPGGDINAHARAMRRTVYQWTRIPVSIGIATSKTLAKLANKIAKKSLELEGVFDFRTVEEPEPFLSDIDAGDLWGVGQRTATWLRRQGIWNVWQLRNADRALIHRKMGIVGLRLLDELHGVSCLPLDSLPGSRKAVAFTRSFSTPIEKLSDLKQAVATFAARVGEKLRSQNSLAQYLTVYVKNDQWREETKKYSGAVTAQLPVATAITAELIHHALRSVEQLYRHGYHYKKAGVFASGLIPGGSYQQNLFDELERESLCALTNTMDDINTRMGAGTLYYAAQGVDPWWKMKQKFRTPSYTTKWDEIAVVKAV